MAGSSYRGGWQTRQIIGTVLLSAGPAPRLCRAVLGDQQVLLATESLQYRYCECTLDPEDRATAGLDTLFSVDRCEAAMVFM